MSEATLPQGIRILLVEDDPVNQKVASAMLKRLGCDVSVASDGWAGIQAFESGDYDAVLMDCMMPDLDGYQTSRMLRERYPDRRVPIIALTANAMSGDRERCIEAGMNDYLVKPVRVPDLSATLGRWVTPRESTSGAGATVAASDGAPAVDVARLRDLGLLDLEPDDEPLSVMFRDTSETKLDELVRAVAEGNIELQRTAAHALKGAGANLGANRLAELAASIEQRARAGEPATADAIAACRRECAMVLDALSALEVAA